MKNNNNKKQNYFTVFFDTLFIMILCFATLLMAMLLKGSVMLDTDPICINYTISWPMLAIIILCLFFYVFYLFKEY